MNERKLYLDYIRILAILLVLFNHLPGYYQYSQVNQNEVYIWIYLLITMITRVNVPLFLMVSGALLLCKNDSLEKWCGRILRILFVLFSLSVLMYVLCCVKKSQLINMFDFLYNFLGGKIDYLDSYWFLYAYLGMLCALPLLRYISQKMSKTDVIVLISLKFIFTSVIPVLNFILIYYEITPIVISGNYQLPFIGIKEMFYPLIGFYIYEHRPSSKTKLKCGLCAIIGIFTESLLTYLQGITSCFTQDYVQLFDYILAIFIFIMIQDTVKLYKRWGTKYIILLSNLTFGIYLFDPFLKFLGGEQLIDYLCNHIPNIFSSFIWIVMSIIIGGMFTYILKKNYFLSKIL